ncbi:zinc finger protein 557-like isoform X2 [Pectinophora gossypiella]|uniref:zinc finger protein 557-like isoform X2 n=1 Tax=Pectinophora gossypiella TaxID=13191 RepID=UPI00214F05EB|nr:zinc finger protein 557-like isoform X2 [Pectinophora gossypiella]
MSVDTYLCLCCLSTDDLSTLCDKNTENNFAKLLKELFAISTNQEESQDDYICKECTVKLRAAHNFKHQVFDSINTLQTIGYAEQDILRTLGKDVLLQSNDADSKAEPKRITHKQIKENKLENVQITDQRDIIRRFLANNPIKALEGDQHVSPSASKEFSKELYAVPDDLKCGICMEIMANVYTFHIHMNKHFPNHICEVCGKGFATEKRLKRHKYCHNAGPFDCEDCGAQFNNYSNYQTHRKYKHTEGATYSCGLCGARFRTLSQRARHALNAHNEDAAFACTQCDTKFITSSSLKNHMKYKHLKIKRHFCAHCEAAYYHKEDLVGHLTVHSGETPFKCTFCNKSYPRKKALIVHLKTHLGDKRFCCDVCGKRFVQKCTLTTHMTTHSREKQNTTRKESKVENIQSKVEIMGHKVENIHSKVNNTQAEASCTQSKVNITQAKVDESCAGGSKVEILEDKVIKEGVIVNDQFMNVDESQNPVLYHYEIFY